VLEIQEITITPAAQLVDVRTHLNTDAPRLEIDARKSVGKVFISYAHEDLETARRLYRDLNSLGADPWLDKEDLLAGQDWEREIVRSIRESSHVLALISQHSVNKRGFVQKELRQALEVLKEIPPDEIFIIPCRLDDSKPRHERLSKLHWVDLFSSYEDGLSQIARSLGLPTPAAEGGSIPTPAKQTRRVGPAEMPDEVFALIGAKAERDFPDDFSTRRYQIQNEISAWIKLQGFQPSDVPEDILSVILSKAEADFPDDFSTRLYQAENEVAALKKLQNLEVPDVPPDVLQTIVAKAEDDFPDDFSTRLYQIENEIGAWRDLYGRQIRSVPPRLNI